MNLKKFIKTGFFVVLVLVIVFFIIIGGISFFLKETPLNISKVISKGDLEDISLTIYYLDPFILTHSPLSVDDLKKKNKIVINDNSLEDHIELSNQINNADLVKVKNKSRVNTRFYYVFEDNKSHKVFEVYMWGKDKSMFINGIEVEENNVFYDILMLFLPEDTVKNLEKYIGRIE